MALEIMGAFNDGEITIAKNGQLYKGSYAKGDLVKIYGSSRS